MKHLPPMDAPTSRRDVIGVGVGPSNLSLAALLRPLARVEALFLDQKPEFQWHRGLMMPDATLQVHYLKDLVSLVDPTSPYSFISFLSKNGRLLQFVNASFSRVLRCEFEEYYRWVSRQIPGVTFGAAVEDVIVQDGGLTLQGADRQWKTRHLVVGTGATPHVPACAADALCPTVMHASEFMFRKVSLGGKRVSVIGGGQTGAEIFKHLIDLTVGVPARVDWISRRANFLPLDESAFTNELYTPDYSDYFFDLPSRARTLLLSEQKLASDGVSEALLSAIFQRMYEIQHLRCSPLEFSLRPIRELMSIAKAGTGWRLVLRHAHRESPEILDSDIVILATGYKTSLPPYLAGLAGRIAWDGGFEVEKDFSIRWDGPAHSKIFVQGFARAQRGVAEPNLGLIPWRNATIVNSILGSRVYACPSPKSFVDWGGPMTLPEELTCSPAL